MSDRKLLEDAAKAAGIDAQWDCPERGMMMLTPDGIDTVTWNPLTDNGDALWLAVKLGVNGPFRINWGYGAVSTEIPAEKRVSLSCEDMEESDPLAATRRAIVRAAAEIGRSKK